MDEDVSFPYDDVLEDMLEENKLKRFKRRVQDKRSETHVECGNS